MEATSSIQMLTFSKIDLLINMLSAFSTVLLGVFGILAVILGYLVWKQNEMRKAAEKEMRKINNIARKMDKLYESYSELIGKAKEMITTAGEIMESAVKKSKKIDNLMAKMEKESKEIADIGGKIKKLRNEIGEDTKRLTAVSGRIPDYPSYLKPPFSDYVAEIKQMDRVLKEYAKRLEKQYSPEAVRRALEMVTKGAKKEKSQG